MPEVIDTLLEPYAFVLGALVGSFLNVVIYRLPDEELSIIKPRSACPDCGWSIPFYLNVPVLSWLALRGRCHNCKRPISIRYPIVELTTALLFLAAARRFGLSWGLLGAALLISALVAITFIDLDLFVIPDELSLPGICLGIALRPLMFDVPWYDGLLGAAIGGAFLQAVRVFFTWAKGIEEAMGFGDVKLIAMLGAFLGPIGLLPVLLVSSVTGTIIGGLAMALGWNAQDHYEESLGLGEAAGQGATEGEPGEPNEPNESDEPAEAGEHDAPSAERPAEEDDEEDWVPPAGAVPFGPFLALGGLFQLFFGPAFLRWWLSVGHGAF